MQKKEVITLIIFTVFAVVSIRIIMDRNQGPKLTNFPAIDDRAIKDTEQPLTIETRRIKTTETSAELNNFLKPIKKLIDTPEYSSLVPPHYDSLGTEGWTFSKAFADARFRLGSGRTFIWNGQHFTTLYVEELIPIAVVISQEESLVTSNSLKPKEVSEATVTEEE